MREHYKDIGMGTCRACTGVVTCNKLNSPSGSKQAGLYNGNATEKLYFVLYGTFLWKSPHVLLDNKMINYP